MNVGINVAPSWHRSASVMLPGISIGFGFFLCKFSCIYSFGVLGIHTKRTSDLLKFCRDVNDPKGLLACKFVNTEIAGGLIGIIFGLVQIGIAVAMLITKNKPELGKVWGVANSILLAFVLTSGVLTLHIYEIFGDCELYKTFPTEADCEPRKTFKGSKPVCANTFGCPQVQTTDVNGIIVTFATIAILDAIFLFASVVILAAIYQAALDSPGGYNRARFPGAVGTTVSNQWPTQSQVQISQSQAGAYNPNQQYYGQNTQMYGFQAGPYQSQQPMPPNQYQPQQYGPRQQDPPGNPVGE